MDDRCVMCGEYVPEGTMVCRRCEAACRDMPQKHYGGDNKMVCLGDLLEKVMHASYFDSRDRSVVYDMVKDFPIADAEPVVHARWVVSRTREDPWRKVYRCSRCGRETTVGGWTVMKTQCPYCYCGAKMDLEEE